MIGVEFVRHRVGQFGMRLEQRADAYMPSWRSSMWQPATRRNACDVQIEIELPLTDMVGCIAGVSHVARQNSATITRISAATNNASQNVSLHDLAADAGQACASMISTKSDPVMRFMIIRRGRRPSQNTTFAPSRRSRIADEVIVSRMASNVATRGGKQAGPVHFQNQWPGFARLVGKLRSRK